MLNLASTVLKRLPATLAANEVAELLARAGTHGLRALHLGRTWDALSKVPGGRLAFGRLVGRIAPYTGTIKAEVLELGPGHARLQMKDRPGLRNHLESIHAIALANLGEETTGLAMMYAFPKKARGIVTRFEMTYHKKARGTLTAECRTEPLLTNDERELVLEGEIRDDEGALVAKATATWLVRPA